MNKCIWDLGVAFIDDDYENYNQVYEIYFNNPNKIQTNI